MTTDITVHATRPADVRQLGQLCASALPFDRHHARMLQTLLREPLRVLTATAGNEFVGVCILSADRYDRPDVADGGDGPAGFVDLLAVTPAWHGEGIGTRLLAAAERQLAATGCTRVQVAGNGPYYAWPGVDVRYIRALALLEQNGYRRRGVEMTMSVDLADAPLDTSADEARLAYRGITFGRAVPAQRAALRAALATQWKSQWLDEIDAALDSPGGGVELATASDGPAGFCAYGGNRPGEVGPLGASAHHRGQGIGTVLIRRALRAVAASGYPRGEIVWAGPVAMFARLLDASVSRVFISYHKPLR